MKKKDRLKHVLVSSAVAQAFQDKHDRNTWAQVIRQLSIVEVRYI